MAGTERVTEHGFFDYFQLLINNHQILWIFLAASLIAFAIFDKKKRVVNVIKEFNIKLGKGGVDISPAARLIETRSSA